MTRTPLNYRDDCWRVPGCNPYAFAIALELDAKTPPVYRFLSKMEYAEDFVQGKIRLSTLGHCRVMENELARDEDEGKITPFISDKNIRDTNSDEDKNFLEDLHSLGGFHFENCTNIRLSDVNFSSQYLGDAFVLCASNGINDYAIDTFGKYCVRIDYPHLFGYYVLLHLMNRNHSFQFKCRKVSYGNQKVDMASNKLSSRIGFEKLDRFSPEREFRFLFLTGLNEIVPQFVQVPELGRICELITL